MVGYFMKKHFVDFTSTQRVCFLLAVLCLVVFAILLPFAFFDMPGLSFGWLLGNLISLFAYLSIVYGSKTLLSNNGAQPMALGLSVLFGSLRFIVYGAGLVLAALCTFYWKNAWLNFWTLFAGYMPMPALVVRNHFIELKAATKKEAKRPIEPKQEEQGSEPNE